MSYSDYQSYRSVLWSVLIGENSKFAMTVNGMNFGNPWILSSEMIEPDGTQLMEDDYLQQYYPELDEGEYRILLHMCFHEAPDEWMTNEPDENDFYIAYEFFVESKILIKCKKNAACTDNKGPCKRHF